MATAERRPQRGRCGVASRLWGRRKRDAAAAFADCMVPFGSLQHVFLRVSIIPQTDHYVPHCDIKILRIDAPLPTTLGGDSKDRNPYPNRCPIWTAMGRINRPSSVSSSLLSHSSPSSFLPIFRHPFTSALIFCPFLRIKSPLIRLPELFT